MLASYLSDRKGFTAMGHPPPTYNPVGLSKELVLDLGNDIIFNTAVGLDLGCNRTIISPTTRVHKSQPKEPTSDAQTRCGGKIIARYADVAQTALVKLPLTLSR